jgi:hypothetical protein
MKRLFVLLAGWVPSLCPAQSLTIQKVEVDGDNIQVYYDLADSMAYRTYTVSLYSSLDDYVSPLKQVSGDVGIEIEPGRKKRITWRSKSEIRAGFEGKVALEVKARVYIPFVRLDKMYNTIKRTKKYKFTWTGGTAQNILNFDLMKGDRKIESFPNIANVGHTDLAISNVRPGSGYYFRITDSKNKDQMVNSKPFTIKRRVPLLAKVIALAIGGGAAYLILTTKTAPASSLTIPGNGAALDPGGITP